MHNLRVIVSKSEKTTEAILVPQPLLPSKSLSAKPKSATSSSEAPPSDTNKTSTPGGGSGHP